MKVEEEERRRRPCPGSGSGDGSQMESTGLKKKRPNYTFYDDDDDKDDERNSGKIGCNGTEKKDYAYRGTWKHKFSRAKNKAKRGGLTKKAMLAKYGRFPRKKEWWGQESEIEWKEKWIRENPN